MQTTVRSTAQGRRDFLRVLSAGALGLALPGGKLPASEKSGSKPLRGVFPIAQTPFTDANQLDLDSLVEQVKFIDRGGVHGFVWPQISSEWASLTEKERFAGAEAIAAAGKDLRPAIAIGVQGSDVAAAVRYAKHAEKVGADAIVSLPPADRKAPKEVLDYYKQVAAAAELPLFVQSTGKMSVELLVDIYKAIPTMRYVKDEAGRPIDRIAPLREQGSDEIKVFLGFHGRMLIEEMRRGSSGSCPTAPFADLYAATWDLWHAGKRREAMAMHARTLLILTDMEIFGFEAIKYILCLRGVFKTHGIRGGWSRKYSAEQGLRRSLSESAKRSLSETLQFVKPFLRA
jgi:4-hydroxy-tetrahydrodipicolinate synthase